MSTQKRNRLRHQSTSFYAALAILAAFILLATTYSVVTPAWEAPDEHVHFQYIVHLLTSRSLPVQQAHELSESHHPPLYYAVAALAVVPADLSNRTGQLKYNPHFMLAQPPGNQRNISFHTSRESFPYEGWALALHLARGTSVLMGLVTVALTIAIGWQIFPKRRSIGLLAGTLIAFNPQFLFISGSVNNDNLVAMAATGVWWQLTRALKQPDQGRQWLYTGLWIGVAVLAKLTGLVAGAVAGTVLMFIAIRRRRLKAFAQGALAMGIPVVTITGWWFVRNQVLYGDPLGWSIFRKAYSINMRTVPVQLSDLRLFFVTQLKSFWAMFGWANVSGPAWFYVWVFTAGLLGCIGLAFFVFQGRIRLCGYQKGTLAFIGLAVAIQEAFIVWSITRMGPAWYQGRLLFPVIGPTMILASVGLSSIMPSRLTKPLSFGIGLTMVAVAIYMPFWVIKPAYNTVPLPKWRLWTIPNKTAFTFGDTFELKGYKINSDTQQVSVTLYWQALKRPDFDYSVFVHLVDESGQKVAQKDRALGVDEGYPATSWWPDDIIAERYEIKLPSELALSAYRFKVGVYNWATGERLPVVASGKPAGDYIVLDQALQR